MDDRNITFMLYKVANAIDRLWILYVNSIKTIA